MNEMYKNGDETIFNVLESIANGQYAYFMEKSCGNAQAHDENAPNDVFMAYHGVNTYIVCRNALDHDQINVYEMKLVESWENVDDSLETIHNVLNCAKSPMKWQKPCEHDASCIKPINTMQICTMGIKYCMDLVESGELPWLACEPCIIEWLCDDPIESCMNPEDDVQLWMKCPHNGAFWAKHIEHAFSKPKWMVLDEYEYFTNELIKSLVECMEKYDLTIKVVEK